MMIHRFILTPKQLLLVSAVIAVLVGGAVLLSLQLFKAVTGDDEAAHAAALNTSIASLEKSYDTPAPETQRLSQLPPEKKTEFIKVAAQYYGVSGDTRTGEAPTPAEITGACVRQKNIELARTYKGMSTETIMAKDAELKKLRANIAADCYTRYSADGQVPAAFVHNSMAH